jgi:hypothetical protein
VCRNAETGRQKKEQRKMEKIVNDVLLTTTFTQEDIEYSKKRHVEIFGSEYGFSEFFNKYATAAIDAFPKTYNPEKDFMLIAKVDGKFTVVYTGSSYDSANKSYSVTIKLEKAVLTDDIKVTLKSKAAGSQIWPALAEIKVMSYTTLSVKDENVTKHNETTNKLEGIAADTTVSALKAALEARQGDITIVDVDGNVIADTEVVKSGYFAVLTFNNKEFDRIEIKVGSVTPPVTPTPDVTPDTTPDATPDTTPDKTPEPTDTAVAPETTTTPDAKDNSIIIIIIAVVAVIGVAAVAYFLVIKKKK